MATIRECMTRQCQWISPEASLFRAARIMAERDLGFLPVGENDRLIGMVTDRDIVVRALAKRYDPETTQVRDVMTDHTYYCYDDQTAEDVCENMAELQIRRMVVVNRDKRLVGAVSFGDLAQAAANLSTIGEAEQQITAPFSHAKAA